VHFSDPLPSIFARDAAGIELGRKALDAAIEIGEGKAAPLPQISARVTKDAVLPFA
jgi:hypothetical protein